MPVILAAYIFAGGLLLLADYAKGRTISISMCGGRTVPLSSIMLVIAWLTLTLIIGLRSWSVGPDSIMYAQQFVVDPSLVRTWTAPLYSFACLILSGMSTELWPLLFLVMAATTFAFLISALWRYSPMPWLSLLMMVCFGFGFEAVNQYRQFLAVSIVLYAVGDLMDGRKRRYTALVLIASAVHITALVALVFLLVDKVSISYANMLKSIAAVAVLFIFALPVLRPLIGEIPYFGNYIGSTHDTGIDAMTLSTFAFRYGVFAVLLFVCSHNEGIPSCMMADQSCLQTDVGRNLDKDARIRIGIQIVYFGMLIQAMAMSFHLLARVPTYMMCVLALVLPNVMVRQSRKTGMLLLVITLVAFIALLLGLIALRDYSGYAYSFVWDRPIDVQSIPRTGW